MNRILRLSMLVDPRFAFDEEIVSKAQWDLIVEDFLAFSQEMHSIENVERAEIGEGLQTLEVADALEGDVIEQAESFDDEEVECDKLLQ